MGRAGAQATGWCRAPGGQTDTCLTGVGESATELGEALGRDRHCCLQDLGPGGEERVGSGWACGCVWRAVQADTGDEGSWQPCP